MCPWCIGRLVEKLFHRRGQLRRQVSVSGWLKGMIERGEERVEIQISLELEFTAMRVFMKYLRRDFLMDMLALLLIKLQVLDILDMWGE